MSLSSDRSNRSRKRSDKGKEALRSLPNTKGVEGGLYKSFSIAQLERIDATAREILTSVGMSNGSPAVVQSIVDRGGKLDENGRQLFSEELIEEALAGFQRDFTLYGRGAWERHKLFRPQGACGNRRGCPQYY